MPDQDSFYGLWADAVAEYEKRTERKIDRDNAFREFDTLEDLEKAIDRDQKRFASFRNEHRKLYSMLAKCLWPLQPILTVVQKGMGNTPFAPACAVMGAASYLFEACASVSKAYDGIEELFEELSNITVRLKEYEYKNIEASLKTKMTDILAYLLEILGQAEACIKRKRIKQWARIAFLGEDDIQASVGKLRRYVETELGLVIALTYGRVKNLQTTTADVQADVKSVKAGISDVLAGQRNERLRAFSEADEKKLSDALRTGSTDEVARAHAANVEKLTKGTGTWIREDVMFQAWEQEKAPILWVFGKPGVGKTMLAARTIEMLHNKYPQHSDIPSLTSVSYLYFKEKTPDLQDCAQMWKAAVLQISKANDRFKKHVVATIDKKQDTFASARRIWQQLFLDFFTEDGSSQSLTSLAFIIVDGLDEGPENERVKFLSCLAELVGRSTADRKCRIQVAVFARPDVRADPGFEKVGFRRQERIIEVTPERNTLDIEAFIRQRLSDVSVLKMLKRRKATKEYQTLAKQIYTSVQSRSQGMFLWASLVFDQIWDSPSPEAIRESLRQAPEGLDDMLHHVFRRLEVEEQMHRSYLRDLLSWVFCSYRPMYISELFVLLLITAEQHCYMVDDDLNSRYSSLFDVNGQAEDAESTDEDTDSPGPVDADAESEADDFDFLDKPDDSENEDQDHNSEAPEDATAESQSRTDGKTATEEADAEDTFDIPPRWCKATVTFSHARIRDYLTTEGDRSTRRWDDCSIVPANLNMTRLDIALACLKILFTNVAEQYYVFSLKTYAKINFIKHLVEVDFTKVNPKDAVQAAQMLCTLFHNGQALLKTSYHVRNEFIQTWFSTNKYSNHVRKIITDHLAELNEEEREWASSVSTSARALFQPLIAACAKVWLTKTGWDDTAYFDKSEREVWIMYAFSNLSDDGTNEASVGLYDVGSGTWNIPLESIEAIANLEPIPKTEHWYAGVAWIMMEADVEDYTERAIEYFKKALEIKPGGWMVMEGLARCYGENLKEYETAIHWMEMAITCLPATEDFTGIDFYLQTRISDWKLKLGNDQEALDVAQTAYEGSRGFDYGTGSAGDDSILRSIKHYIEALFRLEEYAKLTQLLYELDTIVTLEGHLSLWTVFLRAQYDVDYNVLIFDKVGTITRATNDDKLAQFMDKSITKAVVLNSETISEDQPVWLAWQAAEWQYHYASTPEKSISLWETIVDLVDESNEVVQQSQSSYRTKAAGYLSMLHFQAATTAFNQGKDTPAYVTKLENLAKHKQGSKRYYRASYPALVLGLWLHEYTRADEETWRACFRPAIKQGLYLLSDDDPWNDQHAYAQLGQALLLAGDIKNASIALGITTRPLEELKLSQQESSLSQGTPPDDSSEGELVPNATEIGLMKMKEESEVVAEAAAETSTHLASIGDEVKKPAQVNDGDCQSTLGRDDGQNASDPTIHGDDASLSEAAQNSKAEQEADPASHEEENSNEKGETEILYNPKYAGFNFMWTCDGPCQSDATDYAELYFCRVCNDVCFCEKCIQLVKNNEMPFRYCGQDHPHIRAYPMTDEARRMTDALLERQFEVQQEWLDELRRTWEG